MNATPERNAMPNREYTVADLLAASVERHGIKITFGQSIPGAFHLAAARRGIRQVAYRAENAGGCMADGFARVSNHLAVVTAQNGPAAALLVAPLAEALKASVPILAIVQDVFRTITDKNAFQEIDHFALLGGVCKWIKRVERGERLEDYVDMAVVAATSGRPGPAVLLVPMDLLNEHISEIPKRGISMGAFPLDRTVPDNAALDRAAKLIAEAERPLVVAGGGVNRSVAAQALARLQNEINLPVATTPMGKGSVDETHPLSVGVVGYFMGPRGNTRHARKLLDNSDVVLLIGSRTNQNGTDDWKLFKNARTVIHLDIDPNEIGRNYESVRLAGDAKVTIEALIERLKLQDIKKRTAARSGIEQAIAESRRLFEEETISVRTSDASPMRPERLMAELDRRLKTDDIVVADASYSSVWVSNYLRSRRAGQYFITPRGFAGLGWGFPMAMGARLAQSGGRVVCLAGDGGFGHCWAELETAVRERIPVTTIILNNGILGFQKHAELTRWSEHTNAVIFSAVNHAMVAAACGCASRQVGNPKDFVQALDEALASDAPYLIDALIDRDAYPPLSFFEGVLENRL